jgi:hypothetical protein
MASAMPSGRDAMAASTTSSAAPRDFPDIDEAVDISRPS